jgi:hypothetical protein
MDKEMLLKSLKICYPALGEKLIRGLECYHFSGKSMSAFNGSLLIQTELEEEFPINGSITGETFYKLVSELDNSIEFITSDSDLIVKSGRSKTTFPVETVDLDFLEDSEEAGGKTHLPTDLAFIAGLKRCMSTVGGKGIPQEEVGIHVFIDTPSSSDPEIKSECRLYSSNGIAYSRFLIPMKNEIPINQIFLPASFIEQLISISGDLNKEPDEISITQKYIRAKYGSTILRHAFYARNPVSWEMRGQVDQGIEEVALVNLPKEILESLKRCEVITSNSTVKFSIGNTSLSLTTSGSNNQRLLEEIPLEYPFEIELLLDIKGLRKLMESCKEIGFGGDYLLLVGKEDCYDVLLTAKNE